MLPSTNLRTHIAILRDGREINLTAQQYKILQVEKADKKSNEFVKITDSDSGETLFDGELGAIKEFRERTKSSYASARYYCDFGNAHQIGFECDCQIKYNIYPTQFRYRMYELFGKKDILVDKIKGRVREREAYEELYPRDLTPSQRKTILDSFIS